MFAETYLLCAVGNYPGDFAKSLIHKKVSLDFINNLSVFSYIFIFISFTYSFVCNVFLRAYCVQFKFFLSYATMNITYSIIDIALIRSEM